MSLSEEPVRRYCPVVDEYVRAWIGEEETEMRVRGVVGKGCWEGMVLSHV
jgi:hypothetical protein